MLQSVQIQRSQTASTALRRRRYASRLEYPPSSTICVAPERGGMPMGLAFCFLAALGAHLEVLKWAWEQCCPWNSSVCWCAAEGGHLEVMQWAREHGCARVRVGRTNVYVRRLSRAPGGAEVSARARVPVPRGAQPRVGTPLGWGTCTCCSGRGRTAARGMRQTCTDAVEGGHLEVLKWAREHGCPWDAATRDRAARKGYSDNRPLSV